MAKTYNPLHKFRSYVYHFAIIVSDNIQALSTVDSEEHADNLERYMHPEINDENSTKYDVKTLGDVKYVVLYNSLQSAEFTIDTLDMEFENITTSSKSSTTTDANANALTIKVIEPLTVDFMAALYQSFCNVKGIDADSNAELDLGSIKFGLKIFFIGYLDEDHRETSKFITNVNLYEFMIKNMQLSLDAKGATYELACTPMINGIAKDSYMSNIGGASMKLSFKLADALRDFIDAINERVEKSKGYEGYSSKFMKYSIIIDKPYEDEKYQLDNVAMAQMDSYPHAPKTSNDSNDKANETIEPKKNVNQSNEQRKKNEEEIFKPIIMNFKVKDDVQKGIESIMEMSTEVYNDAHKVDFSDPNNPKVYMYKVNIVQTSNASGDFYICHVLRQIVTEDKSQPSDNPDADMHTPTEVLPNVLEWDYIYTGTNIDVLKFDMTINGFLSPNTKLSVLHSNAVKDNKDVNSANKDILNPQNTNHDDLTTGNDKDQKASLYKPENEQIMSPIFRDNTRHGSGSLNPSVVFGMRKAISASPLMVGKEFDIMITGNPLLLGGFIIPPDTYVSNGEPNDAETVNKKLQEHKDKTGRDSFRQLYAKVNVRIPKPSYLQGKTYEEGVDNFYSTKFWWDGSYLIKTIITRFHRGEFTQIIKLIPEPYENSTGISTKSANPSDGKNVENPATSEPSEGNYDNITAFKCMLAEFEQGHGKPKEGYDIMYGGKDRITDYSDHPYRGKKADHTPAGRYQILLGTFDNVKNKIGVKDFTGESQEKICEYLLKYRKVYELIEQGKIHTALKLNTGKNKWTNLENEWESLRPHKHSKDTIIATYKKYGGKVTDDPNGNNDESPKSSGNGDASEFLKIAEKEIGYVEGSNNDTKYGKYWGANHQYWCGMFVDWCAHFANVKMPKVKLSSSGAAEFKKSGKWIDDNPQPGDIIFFRMMNSPTINHVGIVVSDNGDTVTTIEGNTSDTNAGNQRNGGVVAKKSRKKKPSKYYAIAGYGKPDFQVSSNKAGNTESPPEDMDTITKAAYYANKLVADLGISKEQAAAIMGNTMGEGFPNPDRIQGSGVKRGLLKVNGTTGYGWSQWTYKTRQQSLANYAKSKGVDYTNTPLTDDINYGFIVKELNSSFNSALKNLKKTSSLQDATNVILKQYEMPHDQGSGSLKKRTGFAQQILNKM